MDVRIKLVALTMSRAQLQLMLPSDAKALSAADLMRGDPDAMASELASELSGCSKGVQRHNFLSPVQAGTHSLTLLYTQLLTEEKLQRNQATDIVLVPIAEAGNILNSLESRIVSDVVGSLRADLNQVMHSRLNTRGLIHLLDLLPDIFDHKELAAAYYAVTNEKPASPLMLARMMLDKYTIGSREKAREVKGRNLIQEHEQPEPDLLGEKWDRNRDLYRSGGPKAKRLYKKKSEA